MILKFSLPANWNGLTTSCHYSDFYTGCNLNKGVLAFKTLNGYDLLVSDHLSLYTSLRKPHSNGDMIADGKQVHTHRGKGFSEEDSVEEFSYKSSQCQTSGFAGNPLTNYLQSSLNNVFLEKP